MQDILTVKHNIHMLLAMVYVITMIQKIRQLADMMVEIASSSMQSILTAQHIIHIGLAMVTVITLIPIVIQQIADMMVEIVFKLIITCVS